ncbi:MAG: hypothetical protein R3C59_01240 [Planctomycetaceae bacterium]
MSAAFRAVIAFAVVCCVWLITVPRVCAQTNDVPTPVFESTDRSEVIQAVATSRETWQNGNTTVTTLRGGDDSGGLAAIWQNDVQLSGESLVIVDTETEAGHEIQVYAEGRVRFESDGQRTSLGSHQIRLQSKTAPDIRAKFVSKEALSRPSHLMKQAMERLDPSRTAGISAVSMQQNPDLFIPPAFEAIPGGVAPLSRRIRIRPRSSESLRFESFQSRDTVPEEQVYIITGGVNVIVEGVQTELEYGGRLIQPGVLDLSADRVVVWTQPNGADGLELNQTLEQPSSARFQVYLEGNILVRQGLNTVTASHAFVDVSNDRALLMNAELRAVLPNTGGQVRVRAEKLRQLSTNRFHAQNAWTTTSPYGKPGYRVQASDIFVEPGPVSPFTDIDPETGQPRNGPPLWITAVNSQFLIGDVPVLRLPRLTAPAEDPNIPIRRAVVKHDRVFGLQIKTVWNLTKVLGRPKQPGMQWDLLADYLTERGPAVGVQGEYDVRNEAGRAFGNASIIYQYDDGVDNLGLDRRAVQPETDYRGQVIWRHRQELPGRAMIFGEIGLLSDRNYRESFHEPQYDTDKDAETLIGARQDFEAWSGLLLGRTELNEFESSTDWLPKADLFGFSQSLFDGLAYWSSHTSIGYADLEPGAIPPNIATDPYTPLATPYFQDVGGLVVMSRHQIDTPFQLGPVNFRPYVMGEAAFWDEGLANQEDIDRYLFNGGVEAHLAATRILPFVNSDLWNLNGLAHKSDLFFNYSYTDSSRELNEIAQYNEIDDNTTERFRYRYTQQIFPGLIPPQFDPRFYAVRNGAGLWTSAPYHELAADQEVMRLRWRNRLQTKSGTPGSQRIRDWMIFEAGASYFPDAQRDNFGEDFGLLYGNYRWNVSDRTSLLAEAKYDLFDNAQDVWSIGALSQRSLRGSLYVGFRQVEATNFLDSQTLVASYSYQMSPKWISTASFAYDLKESQSRGSSVTFSRVGLDWILHFGLGIDTSKDNVGVAVSLEPRFGPPTPTNLSYLLGLQQ